METFKYIHCVSSWN